MYVVNYCIYVLYILLIYERKRNGKCIDKLRKIMFVMWITINCI